MEVRREKIEEGGKGDGREGGEGREGGIERERGSYRHYS